MRVVTEAAVLLYGRIAFASRKIINHADMCGTVNKFVQLTHDREHNH